MADAMADRRSHQGRRGGKVDAQQAVSDRRVHQQRPCQGVKVRHDAWRACLRGWVQPTGRPRLPRCQRRAVPPGGSGSTLQADCKVLKGPRPPCGKTRAVPLQCHLIALSRIATNTGLWAVPAEHTEYHMQKYQTSCTSACMSQVHRKSGCQFL
eukprot:350415-Chlamydomonas_euryale.AAC.10